MKIVFISPNGLKRNADYRSEKQVGAIEQQLMGLATVMSGIGHETYIIRAWGSEKEIENFMGVNLVSIPTKGFRQRNFRDHLSFPQMCSSFITGFMYANKVREKISKIKPDIVNIPSLSLAYFLSDINTPKILVTHSGIDVNEKRMVSSIKKRQIGKFIKKDGIVVPLSGGMETYLSNEGFKPYEVIPNAVDIKNYKNSRDGRYVLYGGRLLGIKGIEYLIEAFSKIGDNFDMDLYIIGSGSIEKKLKVQVVGEKIERVKFISILPRSQFLEYLSNCSVFVLPSLFETFGVVVIEAMASVKPVIASDIPGPQDIITHGYDGFLFERGNIDELKKYLELCLSDKKLRREIGKNARKTVEEKYTFEKVADSYLKLYEKILSDKSNQQSTARWLKQ